MYMLEIYCIMKFFAYIYIFGFQRQAKVWRTMFIEAMLRVSAQSYVRLALFPVVIFFYHRISVQEYQ